MDNANHRLFVKIERPVLQNLDVDQKAAKKSNNAGSSIFDEVNLDDRPHKFRTRSILLRTIPSISWLSDYSLKNDLTKDIISGCTVAVMNISQGMAYAILANVPAVIGIYMAFFPTIIYAFLGTSRHVAMGSFAVLCLMTGKVVVENTTPSSLPDNQMSNNTGSSDGVYSPVEVATAVAFTVGIFQILMFLCRLGVVCSLLSDTLLSGFTAGTALHVFTSQIKSVFGFPVTIHSGLFGVVKTFADIAENITKINWAATFISVITILVLALNKIFLQPWVKKRTAFPVPIELFALLVGTLASRIYGIDKKYDLRIVGTIPAGLPNPKFPPFALVPNIALESFTIAVVGYIVSLSMALMLAKNEYEIDPNQEFLAQGAANVFGSFFSCAPFAASLSRSVIQKTTGGKTQIASLVSAVILLAVLLWIGPFFEPLPRCILSCIIIVALEGLMVQVTALPGIWNLSVLDGLVWIITYLSVIFIEIDIGLLIGLCASLISLLIQGLRPHTSELSRVPGTDVYVDKSKYSHTIDPPNGKIVRYCGGINFANLGYFKNGIYKLLNICPKDVVNNRNNNKVYSIETIDKVRYVILDISGIHYVDPAGAKVIRAVAEEFNELNILFYVAGTSEPIYESFRQNGLMETNVFTFFPTIHDAVLHAQYTLSNTPPSNTL